MDQFKTTLERAFELAASGVPYVSDIRRLLRSEGFDQKQIYGRTLHKQLRQIIEKARRRPLI